MAQTSDQNSAKEKQNLSTSGGGGGGPNQATTASAAASSPPTTTTTTQAVTTTNAPDLEQDKDFDPTAEALVDEADDERTLEEEEALANVDSVAVQNEIDDLKRESEMPIEELLAYYERMRNEAAAAAAANNEQFEEEEEEDDDDEDDEEEEDDEDEDEDESDEVRKKRADRNKNLDNNNQCSDERLAEQPTTQPTTVAQSKQPQQMQPPAQVSTQLSNSQLLISHQHQHQQQQPTDVSLDNSPHYQAQTNELVLDGQSRVYIPSSVTLDQDLSTIKPTTIQDKPNIIAVQPIQQLIDEPDSVSSAIPRHHIHSMTEFLVENDAAGSIFKTLLDYDLDDSDDLDEDYSYTDDENLDDEREWRRVIHVGPEYQADIPEGLCEYENDLPPYENEDTLVWRCNPEQTQEQILDFFKQASMIPKRNDISLSPASVPKISDDTLRHYRERMQDIGSTAGLHPIEQNHENINNENPPPESLHDVYMSQSRKRFRIDNELEQENAMDGLNQLSGDFQIGHTVSMVSHDNSNSASHDNRPELSTDDYFQGEEQLLYLLLQCNHNFEEALRRRRLDPFKYYLSEPMSLWSQDECLGFEHGLRIYGKNFRMIRDNKVPTRTRAEVVAFYYLWKKSERHDVYTNQYKLDRKRCLTHPGTTDYMDKFIEDNESALNASSSTPTPTPTESTVEVNQIPRITHVNNLPVSACHSSGSGTPLLECLNLPTGLSIVGNCNEQPKEHHQGSPDDANARRNSFYIDSNNQIQ